MNQGVQVAYLIAATLFGILQIGFKPKIAGFGGDFGVAFGGGAINGFCSHFRFRFLFQKAKVI
jgi:hypothetical protein